MDCNVHAIFETLWFNLLQGPRNGQLGRMVGTDTWVRLTGGWNRRAGHEGRPLEGLEAAGAAGPPGGSQSGQGAFLVAGLRVTQVGPPEGLGRDPEVVVQITHRGERRCGV